MLVSRIRTFRSLFGKILCTGSGFPKPLLRTMGHNSTVVSFRHCLKLNIKNLYSMPGYPQSNGQIEATNKTLLSSLKKWFERTKKKKGKRTI